MLKVEFDQKGYQKGVLQFAALMDADLGAVMRDEARLLSTACINRTPPFSGVQLAKMVSSKVEGTPKAVGERRVRLDVEKVFISAKRMKLYSESKSFRDYVNSGDIVGLSNLMRNAHRLESIRATVDPSFHKRQRDRRGRVRKKPPWMLIVDDGVVAAYVAARQAKVGFMKSGWKTAANKFGATVPGWISRHSGTGLAIDETQSGQKILRVAGYNTIGNAQWMERHFNIAAGALKARQMAIAGKIRRVVNRGFLNSKFKVKGAQFKPKALPLLLGETTT